MRIDVVTIFPEYLAPLELSLIGKARRTGLLDVTIHDLRDFTHDKHRTVDDAPAGGGAGMVMRPEPWSEAFDHLLATAPSHKKPGSDPEKGSESGILWAGSEGEIAGAGEVARGGAVSPSPILIVPSPSGEPFTQLMARELAQQDWLVFACGRYEGIDERVYEDAATRMTVKNISLGDYVLNGGEVAVLAIVEAVARLLPGVIGNAESLVEESHEDGLLEYPVYTRPTDWNGREIPEVLNSGHHARIARWRRDERLRRTARRRPDLLEALDPATCDQADLTVLEAEGWVREGPRFRRRQASMAD